MQVKIDGKWYPVHSIELGFLWVDDGQTDREIPPNTIYSYVLIKEIQAVKIGKVVFVKKGKGK